MKFVPARKTSAPMEPVAGVKPVTTGASAGSTVKLLPLTAIPPGVTSEIGPVLALEGIPVTVICVGELTLKLSSGTPLRRIRVVPVRFVPVMTKAPPGAPWLGVKPAMVGAAWAVTVKFGLLVATPPGVTTLIGPVDTPEGSADTVICVAEFTIKLNEDTARPLKRTAVAPVKFVPVITTALVPVAWRWA